MTKKVAIYTRVSTLDQTIDNQLIELRDHCSKMGWEVVKEYADEGLSGTLSREKRPALNSLIKDAYRKRFDSVVCWDISRIGRSMKELILFLSDMKDRGIGICSVRQGFDTSTSMGEIMFQFVGILSSWEREMIRERTLAGLERARRDGKTLGRRKVTNDTMTAKSSRTQGRKKIHSSDCVRRWCQSRNGVQCPQSSIKLIYSLYFPTESC